MSMHFAPQWLKQPIKPSGATATTAAPASGKSSSAQAPAPANPFPALGPRPASPYNTISYSHITHPTSSSPPPASPQEASANGGAHPFRYSRQEILSLFDASKFQSPPIELSHLASNQAVIYSENAVNPIGLREVNEVEKRLLASSVNPRLLRPAPASGGVKGFGKGEGGAFAKENALPALNTAAVGSPVQQQGHRRVPGSIGEKIETPVRSAANNWRPSRTLSSTGSLASPGAGFDGVLGFGSIAPGPPTPSAPLAANGANGLNGEVDAGPGWGSGNRRWRSAAATAQERSSQSTIATPSATPVPERDATVATPAPAQAEPRQEQPQQPAEADPAAVIWYYRDPSGNQQGPFAATQMHDWYLLSYFAEDLPLRRDSETEYHTLRDLKTATGNPTAPFLAKLLPKAPPPMLPPNLPIPGFNMPQLPPAQPWGGFAPPQQNLVAPFDNLAIQHPFAPYPQHMAPQPVYSPVIGAPVQRANGFYSPAVGVPLADAHSPWGVPQQQQQQPQQLPHQQQWQAPMPQQPQQPSYFPQAPAAPSPYVEQPVPRESAAPATEPIQEPVREPSPIKQPEPVPEPEVEAEATASTAEPSPAPAPAVPAPSPWAKVAPVQSTPIQAAAEPVKSSASSPAPAAATPAASAATLPPAHSSLPVKPTARQSVSVAPAAAAATAENSPATTPAKTTPAKAPWAAAKEEEKGRASPVGPSLREIQEAEAKEAKEASARKAAERAAAGSPAPAADSSDLPQQMSWGLPSQGNKGAASPSVAAASGPVWGGGDAAPPKKTLKQIQEEEEKRKARVAAQAKAAAAANGSAAASSKRGYADLAAAPTATAGPGGAWSTVGAGGKASAAPAKPVAAPVKPVVVAARPIVTSISKKAAVDEQPSVEFIRWTKQALVGLSGVNVDEFIQMLLLFPIEPGSQRAETLEIIADSVYANSSTLDGRRFAQEFYTKRKADAQARTSASAKISSLADVVKTQPKPAPTSDFGFKVVKAKGKGRK